MPTTPLRPTAALLAVLSLASLPVAADVVVESAGEELGLAPGDVLRSWRRGEAGGELASPFDLTTLRVEQAPRGPLTLTGHRGGEPLEVALPRRWSLEARPPLAGGDLDAYSQGASLLAADDTEAGLERWRGLLERWIGEGSHDLASWLAGRIAEEQGRRGEWEAAQATYEQAIAAAERLGEPRRLAQLKIDLGVTFERRGGLDRAEQLYRESLELARSVAGTLSEAQCLNRIGAVGWYRGDMEHAEDYFRRALAIRQEAVPGSLDVAASLNNLGVVARRRGNLAVAERDLQQALKIRRRLAPGSMDLSATLNNLGITAWNGHDTDTAEHYLLEALAIVEEKAPDSLGLAQLANDLGLVAMQADDLAAAAERFHQAERIRRDQAPKSLDLAYTLHNLGSVAAQRESVAAARRHFDNALALFEELAPGSLHQAQTLNDLGKVGLDLDEVEAAAADYRRALAIAERLAPGSGQEAVAAHGLGAAQLRRGQPQRAAELFARALDALDTQSEQLGSSRGVSEFTATYAEYYRDPLDLLAGRGELAEAFHVVERYRARGFLALLAERDLALLAELPAELYEERRSARAEIDRVTADLASLAADAPTEEVDRLHRELRAARGQQGEIERRIRVAAPRLGELRYPQPLDLAAARAALDPGTLLLSYAIGAEHSWLFAVGPAPGEVEVFRLAVSEAALGDQVQRLRDLLEQSRREASFRRQAAALSELLLAPAAAALDRAERLTILPDGPLHGLPFAALAEPGTAGERYLVEARPVHVVTSATVFAQLKKRRRPRAEVRVVGFGDPVYPGSASATEEAVSIATRRGLALAALPASRDEVLSLRRLYPDTSRIYLGTEATEAAVKSLGSEASIVHFACHGLADADSPMDSALALSIPATWREGEDNGLLQAWEIFEQVRLDADLVTLSACRSALGRELAGEGMLGLTRAFQYAGARSVLASLWSVSDATTAVLMERFYRQLRDGRTHAEALRRAQVSFLRQPLNIEGQEVDASYPFYWAAFQLFGDWR